MCRHPLLCVCGKEIGLSGGTCACASRDRRRALPADDVTRGRDGRVANLGTPISGKDTTHTPDLLAREHGVTERRNDDLRAVREKGSMCVTGLRFGRFEDPRPSRFHPECLFQKRNCVSTRFVPYVCTTCNQIGETRFFWSRFPRSDPLEESGSRSHELGALLLTQRPCRTRRTS